MSSVAGAPLSALARTAVRYASPDPRALALLRVALGFVLVGHLARHWAAAGWLYADAGVLPSYHHLAHLDGDYAFSWLHAFHSPAQLHVLFIAAIFASVAVIVGFWTRTTLAILFVLLTSLDSRVPLVENGGTVALSWLVLWSVFMPLGQRFSVDGWRARWGDEADFLNRPFEKDARRRIPRLASLFALLNLALIYFFNVVNKAGDLWRSGDAVHYAIHIDRMVTGLGASLRVLPRWLLQGLSFGVLVAEATICVAILWPRGRRATRLVAFALIVLLHAGLGVAMRLGPLSWSLIAWAMILIVPAHVRAIRNRLARRARQRVKGPLCLLVNTADDGAVLVARVLARLDRYHLLELEPDASVTQPIAAPGTADVVAAVLERLPLGPFRWGCGRLLRTRLAMSWWERRGELAARWKAHPQAPMVPLFIRRAGTAMVSLAASYFAICGTWAALTTNSSVPQALTFSAPGWMRGTVETFRLYQRWAMFSPDPVQYDGVLVVRTVDDRGQVEKGLFEPPLGESLRSIDLTEARGAGLEQLAQDYGNRLRLDRSVRHRSAFVNAIRRAGERRGRTFLAVDVFWVYDHSPDPSGKQWAPVEAPIASWRHPDGAHFGVPVPPILAVQSAEPEKRARQTSR